MRWIAPLLVCGCLNVTSEGEGTNIDLTDHLEIHKVVVLDIPVAAARPAHLTVGVPCLGAALLDVDTEAPGPQYECAFSTWTDDVEAVLPACDVMPDARPCARLIVNEVYCGEGDHLALDVVREAPPTRDHRIVLQCVSR